VSNKSLFIYGYVKKDAEENKKICLLNYGTHMDALNTGYYGADWYSDNFQIHFRTVTNQPEYDVTLSPLHIDQKKDAKGKCKVTVCYEV
jgi:hypothetical protein